MWHIRLARAGPGKRFGVMRWPRFLPHHAVALARWGRDHSRAFPWRAAANPFALLVAEMLLRQTLAARAVPVWEELLAAYPTARALAEAPTERLRDILRPLGLFNQRSASLQGMARYLVAHCGGQVPADPAALMQVPHLGPYAAHAVACFAFGAPVPVVDVNVIRVLDRFTGGRTPGPNPHRAKSVWAVSGRSLPEDETRVHNYALLDLAAAICRPAPRCGECPLRPGCAHARRGQAVSQARRTVR